MSTTAVVHLHSAASAVTPLWSGAREPSAPEPAIVRPTVRCFNRSSGAARASFTGVDLGKCRAWRRGLTTPFRCVATPERRASSVGKAVSQDASRLQFPFSSLDYPDFNRTAFVEPDVSVRHHGDRSVVEKNPPSTKLVQAPRRSVKPRVILIAGPTAVGKTRLSIELAKTLGGEVINADSVQVYQGLDVGAAKASLEERQGIPHHVMDLVPPTVEYSYEQFLRDARSATEHILAKGLVPIVVGGTGMYMRWFMQNRAGITSHPFEDEDLTGEFDARAEDDWDYDFQCYFLYQHRADLYPRVDIRCEQMIPALLEEAAWLLNLGVRPQTNSASKAIGYEEAMELLLEARQADGVISQERFLKFVALFQHNSKGLVRKQIAWFRTHSRSEVRKFRWLQAGGPVEEMMEALVEEYARAPGQPTLIASGEELKTRSMKEQKRMKSYKPTLKIYSDAAAVAGCLAWIKSTQGGRREPSGRLN
uniref:tRNA dimethylallyltransferase n=3 Tax=Physcomitrium patens TaxID=3218 RepID=A0A2K1IJ31_PHYPA|nr:hypothetical protein PHYPA_027966 [Physcomitrium patens]PNR29278.1 hypothetical protein PHYPA_027970 [Physcomitrium patens]PNR29279.1 hypothetical protein PHYPA_027971 [Physcomitrium patens]